MKNLLLSLVVLSTVIFVSCGDDSCTQEDWIGTWVLDQSSASCQDTSVSLSDTLVIAAGSDATRLNYDGTDVEFTECSVEVVFITSITSELDGDEIKVNGLGCEGTYDRQ